MRDGRIVERLSGADLAGPSRSPRGGACPVTAEDLAQFALTALARHRLRTGLSLLGVVIGVAAVVS